MEPLSDLSVPAKSTTAHGAARRAVLWVFCLNLVVVVAALVLWTTRLLQGVGAATFVAGTLAVMLPLDIAMILYHAR